MESVLKTIVYYDCLDYPLTFEEIEDFLFRNSQSDSSNLLESLNRLIRKELIQEKGGFYFLKGREK